MKLKTVFVLLATVIIIGLGMQVAISQEKKETNLDAQKLDQILSNQAEILKQFEDIKQELTIIKIRASR